MTCSRRQTAKGAVARPLPALRSLALRPVASVAPLGFFFFRLTRQTRDLSLCIFLYRDKHLSLVPLSLAKKRMKKRKAKKQKDLLTKMTRTIIIVEVLANNNSQTERILLKQF